mgnify:CR=1 FL=1
MIRTSYFWKLQNGFIDKAQCISIALWNPKGVYIKQYSALVPTKSILEEYKYHGEDWDVYVQRYKAEVLAKLDAHKVAEELEGKILLCYEGKNNKKCHRHIVAEWLRSYGYNCEEL